jgi:hypothetical protein
MSISEYAELYAAVRGYVGEVFSIAGDGDKDTHDENIVPKSMKDIQKRCSLITIDQSLLR